ncbi:YqiA/YcfP family alpha/beta fold hydrolase [Aromatoleum diolicum]|uniref:Alpha/beta fold hydrolase n=1 Tax=Aromatoleum diolicum TaxID=75796 RepID=A0ABX1Q6F6_9RHOO|nr:YqiA/YcfP family alpha/beta fold hydrolase [Aromatoleum diolicum]NMG73893.1 alpha/beta fold hydrolase [Aromatoleum diolicum]
MIIYLHGFRSAPSSIKAQALQSHMAAKGLGNAFWCEQLPVAPQVAIARIEAQIAHCRREQPQHPPTLVGSSLGGYYATHLAEKHDLRAVLVNPAVVAPLSLEAYVGEQTNLYTGETFAFTHEYIAQLRAIDVATITRPHNFWLLVETGDEVLDYRDAVTKYTGARQTVLEGGDHGFSRWTDYLDDVLVFAGITAK